jgi:hypothetical protein
MAVDPFRIRGRASRLSALRGDPLLVKAALQRRPTGTRAGVPSGNGYTIPSDGVITSAVTVNDAAGNGTVKTLRLKR